MADSIPSLRRKLAEANLRIAELEARPELKPSDRVVYVTDPILEQTIRNLQEQLRCISQSDS